MQECFLSYVDTLYHFKMLSLEMLLMYLIKLCEWDQQPPILQMSLTLPVEWLQLVQVGVPG